MPSKQIQTLNREQLIQWVKEIGREFDPQKKQCISECEQLEAILPLFEHDRQHVIRQAIELIESGIPSDFVMIFDIIAQTTVSTGPLTGEVFYRMLANADGSNGTDKHERSIYNLIKNVIKKEVLDFILEKLKITHNKKPDEQSSVVSTTATTITAASTTTTQSSALIGKQASAAAAAALTPKESKLTGGVVPKDDRLLPLPFFFDEKSKQSLLANQLKYNLQQKLNNTKADKLLVTSVVDKPSNGIYLNIPVFLSIIFRIRGAEFVYDYEQIVAKICGVTRQDLSKIDIVEMAFFTHGLHLMSPESREGFPKEAFTGFSTTFYVDKVHFRHLSDSQVSILAKAYNDYYNSVQFTASHSSYLSYNTSQLLVSILPNFLPRLSMNAVLEGIDRVIGMETKAVVPKAITKLITSYFSFTQNTRHNLFSQSNSTQDSDFDPQQLVMPVLKRTTT